MHAWEYLANSAVPAPRSLYTVPSRIITRHCSMTMHRLSAERPNPRLNSDQYRKEAATLCKASTCSLLASSLSFAVGVEGTQVCGRGVVPDVAFVCFAQVVVGLVARADTITTDVDGSMDMFENVGDSTLCRHWVAPKCDSVADPHQPPACMQASHDDRNASLSALPRLPP